MQNRQKPLIIAHRGSSEITPENTIASFSKAITDGAEGIELDVRLSKDGVPIVFHDETLERLAQNIGLVIHNISMQVFPTKEFRLFPNF
jgi:glycerophosphoryl diester phosphodiesterase